MEALLTLPAPDCLAEAASLSKRLDELSSEIISAYVRQARDSGQSWEEIGSQLGISKQAAHQRFSSLL